MLIVAGLQANEGQRSGRGDGGSGVFKDGGDVLEPFTIHTELSPRPLTDSHRTSATPAATAREVQCAGRINVLHLPTGAAWPALCPMVCEEVCLDADPLLKTLFREDG